MTPLELCERSDHLENQFPRGDGGFDFVVNALAGNARVAEVFQKTANLSGSGRGGLAGEHDLLPGPQFRAHFLNLVLAYFVQKSTCQPEVLFFKSPDVYSGSCALSMKSFSCAASFPCAALALLVAFGDRCLADPARLSVSPLDGPDGAAAELAIVLQNPGAVVGLQMDLESVAGRFEMGSFVTGPGADGLQLRTAVLASGLTRLVFFSTTNRRLAGGELVRIRGIRHQRGADLEQGLSLRAVSFADDRGLLREFAFSPYVGLTLRGDPPQAGQPFVVDGIIFPAEEAAGGVEVRVNGRMVAQPASGRFSITWTPLEPGQAFVTAMTSRGTEALPLAVAVPGDPLNTYSQWRAFHFPADPDSPTGPGRWQGDADHDNALNAWEYFSGSSPTSAADGQPLVEETVVQSGTDDYLALRVRVRSGATDFEVVAEAAPSLAFAPGSVTEARVFSREAAGDFEVVTFRDSVPVQSSAKRFLRARLRPLTGP